MPKDRRKTLEVKLSRMDYYYLKAIADRLYERPQDHAAIILESYIRANLPAEFRDKDGNELREQKSPESESERLAQSSLFPIWTPGPDTSF